MSAKEIIETACAMNARGLNHATSGNVSVRSSGGFLITPSGMAYEDLTPDQIVEMNMDGSFQGPIKPSSEWRFHLDIYRARDDVNAIVHTHSRHATTLACLRRDLPAVHYMVAVAGGKSVRCAAYATFGSQELSDYALKALEGRKACLLANHGMIVAAENLNKALGIAEEIENLCGQYLAALSVGTPHVLSDSEMDEVLEKFKTYGKQPDL